MQFRKIMLLAPAFILAAACHRNDDRAAADSALNKDLNLANQVAPYDSISPAEAGFAAKSSPASRSPARSSSTTRRTTTRSSSSSGSGRVTTSRRDRKSVV